MKTTLYIALILSLMPLSPAIGQSFAPIGAEWHYSSSAYGAAPVASEYYHLVVEKDTLIEGYPLRKIKRKHYRYQGDSVEVAPYWVHQSGDTVALYDPDRGRLYKLFIFNAAPGDTLLLDIPHELVIHPADTTYRAVVDTIITEAYDGVALRKFVLEPLDFFGWYRGFYLEKVGGYEWFLPLGTIIIPEADGPIRCYRDAEVNIQFSSRPCDDRVISSTEDGLARSSILFPNPASDLVHIESDFAIDHVEIRDLRGNIALRTQEMPIPVGQLSSGIYFVKIHSDKGLLVKKLLKQ